MTISDANPIQFWLNDCPSYNEKETCGIYSACWNQQFQCDDEVRFQLTGTIKGDEYSLRILDENGDVVSDTPFEDTELSVVSPVDQIQFLNSSFDDETGGNPDDWNQRESGVSFNASAIPGSLRVWGEDTGESKVLTQIRNVDGYGWYPGTYKVTVRGQNSSTGVMSPILNILAYGSNDSFATSTSILTEGNFFLADAGWHDQEIEITLTEYYDEIGFRFKRPGSSVVIGMNYRLILEYITITESPSVAPLYKATVYDLAFVPSESSPELCNQKVKFVIIDENASPQEVAKSDYVEFKDVVKCSNLIRYRNNRSYAGLEYSTLTDKYFYLRIVSVFFHEQFPDEDENIELTNKVITLNSELTAKRLFETEYMPYYMHKKTQLALKHQDVSLDNLNWTKQDAYQIAQGNKRHPRKRATVWLTERDFVARNVV